MLDHISAASASYSHLLSLFSPLDLTSSYQRSLFFALHPSPRPVAASQHCLEQFALEKHVPAHAQSYPGFDASKR